MIDALIRTFLRAPLLALILAVALIVLGYRAFRENPKDAIPDIAENQVIVFSEWMGRSPKDVDEQVTYPLTVALQGVPGVREIRGSSGFGWSIVYVVFKDGTDFYWAFTRVLERLNIASGQLPEGVTPRLGPDATALGQIFWYTVENGWYSPERPGLRFTEDGRLTEGSRQVLLDNSPELEGKLQDAEPFTDPVSGSALRFSRLPLDRLRSIQDFDVTLALESVEGVSEVASIGGYVRQYQIDIDPESLRAFDAPLSRLIEAVRRANIDIGAKVVEENGMEILVRGVGFLGGDQRDAGERAAREDAVLRDIESIVVHANDGTPVYLHQLGTVSVGPDFRRGALDKMGAEAVGGCVTMRFGENPLSVIERVKDRINTIERGLPPGVRVNAFYDRSKLIHETMATLSTALSQELAVTIAAALLFLLHFRSSLVIAVTLPLAVLFAFICMQALKLPSNIMSLAGIAIAIGTMVDMGIIMLENIFQHLTDRREEYGQTDGKTASERCEHVDQSRRRDIIQEAASEVGPAILTAISTTVISFIPVFFLEGQAAKLFTPLAWTKTFCMVGAVILALTLVPPLASLLLRERRMRLSGALVTTGVASLAFALGWWIAPGLSPRLAEVLGPIESYLGWGRFRIALAAGLAVGLVTFAVVRERIRPVEENPVSRLIRRAYEPTLRWILNHKPLFLLLPTALVVWGLGTWLGWGGLLNPINSALHKVALGGLADWLATRSQAFWIHIILGLLVGCLGVGLLLQTARALIALSPRAKWLHARWVRPGQIALTLAASAGIAAWLHHRDFADQHAREFAALTGLPELNPETGQLLKPLPDPETGTREKTKPGEFALGRDYLLRTSGIGREFMPPLDEGDFLYMPSVLPAGSINTVMDVMQKQDVQFAQIPEVDLVVGKLGRIESPLDPAPVGMLETMILLRPREQWPLIDDPDYPGMKRQRTMDEIWRDIQDAGRFPGVTSSVQLQPIRTRVEMLSTGFNAKIGIKIYGDSIDRCEELAVQIEQLLRERLHHADSVNAVRISGKPYLEFKIDREAISRYGVNISNVQQVIEIAIGGQNLTTTYEALDRYPVRIRYQRELRDEVPDLERVLVPTPSGAQIPIAMLADIERVTGPMSVRREGAKYVSYVTMSNVGIDETTLVRNGQRIIDEATISGDLDIPEGYYLRWAGSYERNLRASKRLAILVPLVLVINTVLIYLQFKRLPLTIVIFLAIPVAFSGGFILIDWWPDIQNRLYTTGLMDRPFPGDTMYLTVAVWVGFIALFGIAVDDGIVFGTYLDQVFSRSRIRRYEEIEERVVQAGLRRVRPALMTTFTTLVALIPVLLSTGRGSDVMTPMALPVFGGMFVAVVTIFVVPTCYCGIKQLKWRLNLPDTDFERE